jgi:hypothetical protein
VNDQATEIQGAANIQREIAPVLEDARSVLVRNQEERTGALEFAKRVKAAQKRVADFFEPLKTSAHKTWKAITSREAELLDPLKSAEQTVKRKVLDYDSEQERLRLAEQRRLQAEADERARKEQERLERQAEKVKTPERREALLEQAAMVVAPVVEVAQPEKVKGESTRRTWKAVLTDKTALLRAAAEGNDLAASLLNFDQTAANRLAVSTKGAITVAGVSWIQEATLAIGARGEN